MRKIHKFKLDIVDRQIIIIPGYCKVFSVLEQFGNLVLYADVETDRRVEYKIEIAIIGTGNPNWTTNEGEWKFLNSVNVVKIIDKQLVWHIFYRNKHMAYFLQKQT